MTEERVEQLLHTMTSREFYNAAGLKAEEKKPSSRYSKYSTSDILIDILNNHLEYIDEALYQSRHKVKDADEKLAQDEMETDRKRVELALAGLKEGGAR